MKVNAKKYRPHTGRELKVYTSYGEQRSAIYGHPVFAIGFVATDCNHPMQNINLDSSTEFWEYVNCEDYDNYPPIVNHYYHEEQGENILKSVPQKKWWQFWKH